MPLLLTRFGENTEHYGYAGPAGDAGPMLQGREQASLWMGDTSSFPPVNGEGDGVQYCRVRVENAFWQVCLLCFEGISINYAECRREASGACMEPGLMSCSYCVSLAPLSFV